MMHIKKICEIIISQQINNTRWTAVQSVSNYSPLFLNKIPMKRGKAFLFGFQLFYDALRYVLYHATISEKRRIIKER